MIEDDEIIIEDELLTPEAEELMRQVLFDPLPEDLSELAEDYDE